MTKEILFIGKRVDNGEWVVGDLIHRQIWKRSLTIIRVSDDGFDHYEEYEVISETVGEFTGLVDKYGKKIFEGDIIRYYDEDCYYYPEECTEFFGKVVQECGAFGVGTQNELPLELENWCGNDNFVSLWEIYWNLNCCDGVLPMIEVIGNVYDNKELLENG